MKKILVAALLGLGVATSTVGCATWWNDFKNNPVQVVTSFEAVVQTVLSDIAIAWSAVQPFVPASVLPTVSTAYQQGLATVNHALAALNAAVQVASDTQQANPDFTALMASVSTALKEVIAIIDQYGGSIAAPSAVGVSAKAPVPGLADAHAGLASLSRWTH